MTNALAGPPYVIPAHPLAVTDDGHPDWPAQRLLSRYYLAAGATGLALGVHTTQFQVHDNPALFKRVLAEAADVTRHVGSTATLIAGISGDLKQAVEEAEIARELGYVAGLLSSYGWTDHSEAASLDRARAVAEVMPIIGFYMQEAVGGRYLSPSYWNALLEVENLVAIKVAPFDRYRTADVAEALALSGRDDVALLTGNDDTIVTDLVLPHRYGDGRAVDVRFAGGLLGQWAVGTKAAVDLTRQIWAADSDCVPREILAVATMVTSINHALFDPEHKFAGSIAGVNELLRQQGLLNSSRCLSDRDRLSDGQKAKIELARKRYPELLDEEFIAMNIDAWRAEIA